MDEQTKQLFDVDQVSVIDEQGLLTTHYKKEEIVRLAGAPSGSVVEVLDGHVSPDFEPAAGETVISLVVSNDERLAAPMQRVVIRRADGSLFLYNELFVLKPAARKEGLGTRSFALQAEAARALGFQSIATVAVRELYDNETGRAIAADGYVTWPLMGYDGPIPDEVRAKLPSAFRRCLTVRQLYDTPGGREAWALWGDKIALTFLLSDDESWRILEERLERKQIDVK